MNERFNPYRGFLSPLVINSNRDVIIIVGNSDDSSKSGIRPTLCLSFSSPYMWAILSEGEQPTILVKLPTQFLVTSYEINLSYEF